MTASRRRRSGLTPLEAASAGFTLIELTLVTLLVLILIGLSTPIFKKTFSDLSARDTSFGISKLINYAQEMAVLERKNYKIAFDFKNGKYQLLEAVSPAKPPVYKKAAGRFGKLFGLPQGLSLSGDRNGVIFYPDGHCDEIRVNVSTKSGGYSVILKRFGNMVEIKPFDPSTDVAHL
ncbi:MAG: hypothetical protein A3K16_06000 [Omnitrophica bacterium RIFCSPLOWO2_01_FULL_45_24]|nr:MAG: hypothetical protein A3K16_06000 [Omnitrophica bacterium RIFCSPLOWO2_01_FULL_45_24]